MQRIAVVGGPGSGKSTVAALLAERVDAPHVELDELWWQAGWTPAGRENLRRRMITPLAANRWVVDGNYLDEIADLVWPRADIIVWMDPPRSVAVRRAVLRSGSRVVRKSELWNGNRQPLAGLSPRSISGLVRRWPTYSAAIARTLAELTIPDEVVVRLGSDAEVDRWLSDQ